MADSLCHLDLGDRRVASRFPKRFSAGSIGSAIRTRGADRGACSAARLTKALAIVGCFLIVLTLRWSLLYERLEAAGRLTRPKHWQEFIPFEMARTPLKMTIAEARAGMRYAWANSYSPEALEKVNSAFESGTELQLTRSS